MTLDPCLLLTEEEVTMPRTPTQLVPWVAEKIRTFKVCKEEKGWVLLLQGLSRSSMRTYILQVNLWPTSGRGP